MTKQTIFISQPAHCSLRQGQLLIYLKKTQKYVQHAIEGLAIIVLEHREITLTQQLLAYLGGTNVAAIFCDRNHLPNSMLLSFDAYYLQSTRFNQQISAGKSLKKQLWQKTIKHKIQQQAALLKLNECEGSDVLEKMAKQVKSGDPNNLEAQAANLYWQLLLGPDFHRTPTGLPPNQLLNYGYAILRAAVARSLAGHGLLNTLGIHHHHQYNAFCLADDIMEPYRPFVDAIVYEMEYESTLDNTITKQQKAALLSVLTMDCVWEKERTTVGKAIQRTASSLGQCFEKKRTHQLRFPTYYVSS